MTHGMKQARQNPQSESSDSLDGLFSDNKDDVTAESHPQEVFAAISVVEHYYLLWFLSSRGKMWCFFIPISIRHIRFSFFTMDLLSPNPVPFYSLPIRILFCWLMAIFLLFLNHTILIHKYRDSATARMLSYPRLLCQILWKWAVWIFNQNTFSTS